MPIRRTRSATAAPTRTRTLLRVRRGRRLRRRARQTRPELRGRVALPGGDRGREWDRRPARRRVVEAYWIGSSLLERVGSEARWAAHSTSVSGGARAAPGSCWRPRSRTAECRTTTPCLRRLSMGWSASLRRRDRPAARARAAGSRRAACSTWRARPRPSRPSRSSGTAGPCGSALPSRVGRPGAVTAWASSTSSSRATGSRSTGTGSAIA